MTCPLLTNSTRSKTTPKHRWRRWVDEYEAKNQFTWMLARETLEQGTIESRRSPISHSDSSISRPAPLISVSSSTTVLCHTRNTHGQIPNCSTVRNRSSSRALYPQTYLKIGTGYAWAGHCNVKPWASAISNVRLLSIVENLGFARPTGSIN